MSLRSDTNAWEHRDPQTGGPHGDERNRLLGLVRAHRTRTELADQAYVAKELDQLESEWLEKNV